MAVNRGGSQAVVLQLELFCPLSSVSLRVFARWHLPIKAQLKQSPVLCPAADRTGEWRWGRVMGGHAMLLDMHLHMHTADGTGGALNKHTHTHLLADGRLGVRQCPLMNVYGESKGPSSFRSPSMRCSVMTMVIPPSLHNNHTQVMVSKWFISITHIRQMLLRTRVNLSCGRHRAHAKREKVFRKKIYC